jgi:hypothetical protein
MKLNEQACAEIETLIRQAEGHVTLAMDVANEHEDVTVMEELNLVLTNLKMFRCVVLNRDDHLSVKDVYVLQDSNNTEEGKVEDNCVCQDSEQG